MDLESIIFYDLIFSEENRAILDSLNENMFVNKSFLKYLKKLNKENRLEVTEIIAKNQQALDKIMENGQLGDFNGALKQIKERFNLSKIKKKIDSALKMIASEEPVEVIESYLEQNCIENEVPNYIPPRLANQRFFDYAEEKSKRNIDMKFGIEELDKKYKGISKFNLICVGARAGTGKTLFAIQTAVKLGEQGKKVLYFSLEMGSEELSTRIYSNLTKIDSKDLFKPENIYKLGQFAEKYNSLNIMINDEVLNFEDITRIIKTEARKGNVDVVIIDHVGLMTLKEKSFSRENEVSKMSKYLKYLAKTLKVPIIALTQLNRTAQNTEPTMAMLRDSGSWEQDADKVILLWQEQEEKDKAIGTLKIKVDKNRGDATGKFEAIIDKRVSEIVS